MSNQTPKYFQGIAGLTAEDDALSKDLLLWCRAKAEGGADPFSLQTALSINFDIAVDRFTHSPKDREAKAFSPALQELKALRTAFKMMGLDPSKVSDLVLNPGNDVCKAILLGCVDLSDDALLKRAGKKTDLDGWRRWFKNLKVEPDDLTANPAPVEPPTQSEGFSFWRKWSKE